VQLVLPRLGSALFDSGSDVPDNLAMPAGRDRVRRTRARSTGASIKHLKFATTATDSVLAIKTAWRYLDAYGRFVCVNRCIGCSLEPNGDDDGYREFLDSMRTWETCQKGLHRIFAKIPSLHSDETGCPACAIAQAFQQFPVIAKLSPVPPPQIIRYTEDSPAAHHFGLTDWSYPCHVVVDEVDGEVRPCVGLAAMRSLNVGKIPGLPRGKKQMILKRFLPGQRVVRQLYELHETAVTTEIEKAMEDFNHIAQAQLSPVSTVAVNPGPTGPSADSVFKPIPEPPAKGDGEVKPQTHIPTASRGKAGSAGAAGTAGIGSGNGDDEQAEQPDADTGLSPSRRKAYAAYDWAMKEIPGAENMTYQELHAAIMNHPKELTNLIPHKHETFARYVRDAGAKRNHTTGGRRLSRSVCRQDEI